MCDVGASAERSLPIDTLQVSIMTTNEQADGCQHSHGEMAIRPRKIRISIAYSVPPAKPQSSGWASSTSEGFHS